MGWRVCCLRGAGTASGTDWIEGRGMDLGGRTTGTWDEHYDPVSVLYHAQQGADAYEPLDTGGRELPG